MRASQIKKQNNIVEISGKLWKCFLADTDVWENGDLKHEGIMLNKASPPDGFWEKEKNPVDDYDIVSIIGGFYVSNDGRNIDVWDFIPLWMSGKPLPPPPPDTVALLQDAICKIDQIKKDLQNAISIQKQNK